MPVSQPVQRVDSHRVEARPCIVKAKKFKEKNIPVLTKYNSHNVAAHKARTTLTNNARRRSKNQHHPHHDPPTHDLRHAPQQSLPFFARLPAVSPWRYHTVFLSVLFVCFRGSRMCSVFMSSFDRARFVLSRALLRGVGVYVYIRCSFGVGDGVYTRSISARLSTSSHCLCLCLCVSVWGGCILCYIHSLRSTSTQARRPIESTHNLLI
jgi:hypothetical protein